MAKIVDGIPRFVDSEGYAESFGWQWNHWEDELSDSRSPSNAHAKRKLVLDRTCFDRFTLEGRTILECGTGGGDDTEILLSLPFAEVHSFDVSRSVDRAHRNVHDPRLTLSQADIFKIPYPDQSFDFVYCHRVLQHTPDPERALRSIAKKVKKDGILFVHSYHRSLYFMTGYKYKYRWLTRRIPSRWVHGFVETAGPSMFRFNQSIDGMPRGLRGVVRELARMFLPFERLAEQKHVDRELLLEQAKLVTFDALTPAHDHPMTWRTMRRILLEEGFEIRFRETRSVRPLWCTAVRVRV